MIVRSYMCSACGHYLNVTLTAEQWDAPCPECPNCSTQAMAQDFKPVAIGGSARSRAEKITEDILEKDYHVGDIKRDDRREATPQVRYKDQAPPANASHWVGSREALEGAVAAGRQSRLRYGSGLDVLQSNLKTGEQPDLIEISKRRAMRVY
jgi:DNA-directed RNA polymerase subunit RPC12/RpoP